jgi:hypothetical protein
MREVDSVMKIQDPYSSGSGLSKVLLRNIGFLVLSILLLFDPSSSWAQAMKKVPLPFSPIGINCLPWFVAKEARIYQKHGIDVDPVFIGASSALFQSMLSGAADMAGSGGPSVISNVLQGGDIIHVTAMVPRFTQSIMVKPEIKKPEDMQGKKIGVSRLGTVTHFALQTALCSRRLTTFNLRNKDTTNSRPPMICRSSPRLSPTALLPAVRLWKRTKTP